MLAAPKPTNGSWEINQNYAKVPMGLMQREELDSGAKLLFVLITDKAKDKGWVKLSQAWLCFMIGVRSRVTLRKYIAQLVEQGLIRVTSGKDPGNWNTYRLLDHIWLHKAVRWSEDDQGGRQKVTTRVVRSCLQIQSSENREEERPDQTTGDPLRGSPPDEDLLHVKDPVIVHDQDLLHEKESDAVKLEEYSAIAAAKRSEEAKNAPSPEPEQVVEIPEQSKTQLELAKVAAAGGAKKGKKAIIKRLNKKAVKDWGKESPSLDDKLKFLHTRHTMPDSMKIVAHKIGDVWHDEFQLHFPGIPMAKTWGAKEMLCSAELVLGYNFEQIVGAVQYFIRNWETLQPRVMGGKVSIPTIGVLKAVHDTIVSEAGKIGPALKAKAAYDEWSKNNPNAFHAPEDLKKAYQNALVELKAFGLKP